MKGLNIKLHTIKGYTNITDQQTRQGCTYTKVLTLMRHYSIVVQKTDKGNKYQYSAVHYWNKVISHQIFKIIPKLNTFSST